MSYYIRLYDPNTNDLVRVVRHTEGGTYNLFGTERAELIITYNYAPHYYRELDPDQGIHWLYGKTGAETVRRLEQAVKSLGTEQHNNYWEPTPGNAGYALSILFDWALQYPQGVWKGG